MGVNDIDEFTFLPVFTVSSRYSIFCALSYENHYSISIFTMFRKSEQSCHPKVLLFKLRTQWYKEWHKQKDLRIGTI